MTDLFSLTIMGVSSRYEFIKGMLKKLPERTTLTIDRNMDGCWLNARKAWLRYSTSPYHLVLQDDLELPDNFEKVVNNIINANPSRIISLFCPRSVKEKKGSCWTTVNGATGQALLMPTSMIKEMFDWVHEHCLPKPPGNQSDTDDLRISIWMLLEDIKGWFTVPSVVQHIGTVSTLFGRTHTMPSLYYPTDTSTLMNVDWTKGLDNPGKSRYTYNREYRILKPQYRQKFDKV